METSLSEVHSLDELRQFLTEVLCEHSQLEVGAFPLTERVLLRGHQPCGILFCLHGPRAVKYTAIWETDRNRVLFYGCDGERFQEVQLEDGPRLECLAA